MSDLSSSTNPAPQVSVYPSPKEACAVLAAAIAESIRERARQGESYVLGLATGSTPIPLYQELIRIHRDSGLSFRNVISFNLDEYYGLSPLDPKSYHHFMRTTFCDAVDIPAEQWHIPSGDIPRDEIKSHCLNYEERIARAGGIDLQILGIGRTGHIGFNEPPSAIDSATRLINLDELTRQDAADSFDGLANVPQEAITMGIGTILKAREIALLAWGAAKSEIIGRSFTDSPTPELPASFLRTHPKLSVYLDRAAAQNLPHSISCLTS